MNDKKMNDKIEMCMRRMQDTQSEALEYLYNIQSSLLDLRDVTLENMCPEAYSRIISRQNDEENRILNRIMGVALNYLFRQEGLEDVYNKIVYESWVTDSEWTRTVVLNKLSDIEDEGYEYYDRLFRR